MPAFVGVIKSSKEMKMNIFFQSIITWLTFVFLPFDLTQSVFYHKHFRLGVCVIEVEVGGNDRNW